MRCENESNWQPSLLHAIDYLKGLKLQNGQFASKNVRKTGVVGFLASALSVMHMFDCLVKQQHVLKYILTYKFSQDHLELFFSVVRSRGDSNNNPSAVQLRATRKRLLTHNQLRDVTSGNCERQSKCQLLNISSCIDQMQRAPVVDINTITYMRRMDAQPEECNMHIDQDHDYIPTYASMSKFVDNVVVYTAGFVVRSLNLKLFCDICKEALQSKCMHDDVYRMTLICWYRRIEAV